ncbi:hypothetical protein T492DRAFT_974031 [Pavlovales sp. CCMP2436]|nr:hypothetical protein T492DRAFT_974031 [Pavlovales sp. CCMP2436]
MNPLVLQAAEHVEANERRNERMAALRQMEREYLAVRQMSPRDAALFIDSRGERAAARLQSSWRGARVRRSIALLRGAFAEQRQVAAAAEIQRAERRRRRLAAQVASATRCAQAWCSSYLSSRSASWTRWPTLGCTNPSQPPRPRARPRVPSPTGPSSGGARASRPTSGNARTPRRARCSRACNARTIGRTVRTRASLTCARSGDTALKRGPRPSTCDCTAR